MYETPKLKQIGQAEDVVLGIDSWGDDLDGCMINPPFEFAAEEEFEEN